MALPAAAGLSTPLFDGGQLAADQIDPAAQMTAVIFQLALTGAAPRTGAAGAAAALTGQSVPQTGQTGQAILQGGEFGLQLALIGGGPGSEDVQNQQCAVYHRQFQSILQILDLVPVNSSSKTQTSTSLAAQSSRASESRPSPR